MNQRIVQVAVLTLLLATQVSHGFSQTSSELNNFLSQRLGLNQDQIAAIQHGQPFAKNAEPRSPAEIFVIGVIYINAAPERYIKFVSDFNNLRFAFPNSGLSRSSAIPRSSRISRALDSTVMT